MATWQFDLFVIPRNRIQQLGCAEKLDADCYDQHEWWDSSVSPQDVSERIDMVLKRGSSWSRDILMWGTEDGNRINLCVKENVISELLVRLDLRDISRIVVNEIVRLAADLNCIFCTSDWKLIEPVVGPLVEAIAKSDAARFVAGPAEFLEKLSK